MYYLTINIFSGLCVIYLDGVTKLLSKRETCFALKAGLAIFNMHLR